MLYDIAHFWVALLIAVVLGILVGWFTRSDAPRHGPLLQLGRGWIFWSAVVFLFGLGLAIVHVIPDRPGLWLETGLLLFVAYLVGCPLSGLLPVAAVGRGSTATGGADISTVRPAPVLDGGSRPLAGPVGGAVDSVDGSRSRVKTSGNMAGSAAFSGQVETFAVTDRVGSTAKSGHAPVGDGKTLEASSDPLVRTTGIISDDPDSVDQPKSSSP